MLTAFALILLAVVLLLVLTFFVFAAFIVSVVRRVARLGQVELLKHVEAQRLERLLVVKRVQQAVKIIADALLDEFAHQLDAALRRLGHRFTGQLLAQHQAKGGLQRHIVAALCARNRIGKHPQLRRAFEVGLDPAKPVRPQCLIPYPLELIIASARGCFGRCLADVQIVIVMA